MERIALTCRVACAGSQPAEEERGASKRKAQDEPSGGAPSSAAPADAPDQAASEADAFLNNDDGSEAPWDPLVAEERPPSPPQPQEQLPAPRSPKRQHREEVPGVFRESLPSPCLHSILHMPLEAVVICRTSAGFATRVHLCSTLACMRQAQRAGCMQCVQWSKLLHAEPVQGSATHEHLCSILACTCQAQ
jgi:hypothetical protein